MPETLALDWLEQTARAATQAPWICWTKASEGGAGPSSHGNVQGPRRVQVDKAELYGSEDAAHIAAFQPATALALLREIARLRLLCSSSDLQKRQRIRGEDPPVSEPAREVRPAFYEQAKAVIEAEWGTCDEAGTGGGDWHDPRLIGGVAAALSQAHAAGLREAAMVVRSYAMPSTIGLIRDIAATLNLRAAAVERGE